MPNTFLRKYGQSATILFALTDYGTTDLETGASFASADVKIIKDEGAAANTTNLPTNEGNGLYSLVLTASEMTATRVYVVVVDTSPKVWEDEVIIVDTYGHTSAQHAFDL